MNTSATLVTTFKSALCWNALYHGGHKITTSACSIMLYASLSTEQFAAWANGYSILFLYVLWFDCGMRKTVPRFWPIVANEKKGILPFIQAIAALQTVALSIATIPFIASLYMISTQFSSLHVSNIALMTISLWIEGWISLLKTLYHAQFQNRAFSIIATSWLLLEILATGVVFKSSSTEQILTALFISKLCTSTGLLLCLIKGLQNRYPSLGRTGTYKDIRLPSGFIRHAYVMWITTILKSLSERNFLVPFFTLSLGAPTSSLFKIANDLALLFYRFVLKTIGTADIALLSQSSENNKGVAAVLKELRAAVAGLALPLFVAVLIYGFFSLQNNYESTTLLLFVIMTFGYLIEILLLPYERLLEAATAYSSLALIYLFYCCGLITLIVLIVTKPSSFSIVAAVTGIHAVRILSLVCMVYARPVLTTFKLFLAWATILRPSKTAICLIFTTITLS